MIDIPTIHTDRLTLRAPTAQDVPALAAFYASDAARFVGGPMTEAQAWRYLCEVIGHWSMRGYGRWITTLRGDKAAIGLVGLHNPLDWPEAEVGWYIWSGNGKGYATEAGKAARAHAYDRLGWSTVISMIAHGNEASVRVATSMGAEREEDFQHPTYGAMGVYRHPGPEGIA